MKNRKVKTENKEGSSQKEEVFFVQSNIDDLLNNQENIEKTEYKYNKPFLNENTQTLPNDDTIKEDTLAFHEMTQPQENQKTIESELETEEKKFEKYEEKKIKEELKAELATTLEKPKQKIVEDEQLSISEQRKKLDEAEQSVSKHSSKKSKILSLVFFFVNIAIVVGILVYQLTKEGDIDTEGISISIGYLFAAILLFIATMSIETLAISYLVKQSTGKWRLGFSYKVAGIGRYYDSVTPMATGGQPFQISYMKSRGMPLHTSLSIPLAKYEFHQMAWVTMSLICLIISRTNDNFSTFVSVTSIIGFVIGFVILFVTVFLSVCKSLGKKIVVKILKLLHKMKIVKNYDKQYEKIIKYISDFQDVMRQYARSPKDFISMFLICFAKLVVNYSMPFFIVKLFMPGLDGGMYMNLFVMSMLVDLSSSFFPLPGGTGLNELSFQAAFGSVIGQGNLLVVVLLVWRFFSYYVYLLQGLSILSYDVTYGNRKYRWQVKRDKLAEESAIFKQNQIDRFREERAKRRKTSKKNNKFKEYL